MTSDSRSGPYELRKIATAASFADESRSGSGRYTGSDLKQNEPLIHPVGDDSLHAANSSGHGRVRHTHRKTLYIIFGHLLLASVLILGQFFFFSSLNGRPVEEMNVGQSIVTASSLLFVMLIKGLLTICVGTCFVQHLWSTLQEEYSSLGDIERMFNMRRNIIALLNPRSLWKAPLLFAMASYLWLLTIVLIYPPSTLIVSMDSWPSLQSYRMSVMNQTFPDNFDPLDEENSNYYYPSLSLANFRYPEIDILNSSAAEMSYGKNKTWYGRFPVTFVPSLLTSMRDLNPPMVKFARYVLSTGQMSRIESPPHGSNFSYVIEFDGPRVNCTPENGKNTSTNMSFNIGMSTNPQSDLRMGTTLDPWNFRVVSGGDDTFHVDFAEFFGYIPDPDQDDSRFVDGANVTLNVATRIRRMTCTGYSTVYRVNITNQGGSQTISYGAGSSRQLKPVGISFTWTSDEIGSNSSMLLWKTISRQSTEYKQWLTQVPGYMRAVNAFSLFGCAFESIRGYHGTYLDVNVTQGVNCKANGWTLTDEDEAKNRTVDICPLMGNYEAGKESLPHSFDDNAYIELANQRAFRNDLTRLEDSAFNTRRFKKSTYSFQPVQFLNITEASINDLLANISISALTQENFFDNVTVHVQEFRNVYHFTRRVSFWVPYLLCLAIALFFSLVAWRALRKSAIPVADGGFLQIMMTTRGDTKMERLVVEQGPRSVDEIKGELAALKVRLGEVSFKGRGSMGEREVRKRLAFRTEAEKEVGRRRDE